MHAHHTAKGIASLGRHGDDMIVHMSRDEVKGLQALAQQQGTSLTINPHTGMPEAFKLGRILGAIAPIAAGWALGPGGFGLFSSPFTAALAVGAGTGLLTGNLGQGLMAGLGAYGGYGLGDTFAKMGASAAGGVTPTMTANMTQAATGAPLVGASSQFISPFTPQGIAGGAGLGVGTVGNAGLVGQTGLTNAAMGNIVSNQALNPSLTAFNPTTTNINPTNVVSNTAPTSGFSKSAQGVKNLFTWGDDTTKSGWQQFKEAAGTPGKPAGDIAAAAKLAGPAFSIASGAGAFDEPTYTNEYGTRMKRVPTGTYDAQGNMEYKYVPAESYAPTETLNVNNPYANYGYMTTPPALQLKAEGGEIKSYAIGGGVNTNPSAGAGISDLYNRPEGQTLENISQDGYGIGRLNSLANAEAMNMARVTGYAGGGPISFDEGGSANLNVDAQPTLNVDSIQPNYGGDLKLDPNNNPPIINNMMIMLIKKAIAEGKIPNPNKSSLEGIKGLNINTTPTLNTNNINSLNTGMPAPTNMNNINPANLRTTQATGMAKGGYLDGPGDGMSDSIPATIEGKQPARLADGEFVVPADVVSHLGNGSSKAGSKRLYAMLDKVRQARTGTKKQGKQINPAKYMPA